MLHSKQARMHTLSHSGLPCKCRHRFAGPATNRISHTGQQVTLPQRPGSPVSRQIQTAGYVSRPGWDDNVQISGTPRQSTPRVVHLPVTAVKRGSMTPGAARLSAWRNAKVCLGQRLNKQMDDMPCHEDELVLV